MQKFEPAAVQFGDAQPHRVRADVDGREGGHVEGLCLLCVLWHDLWFHRTDGTR
jgi:hypothetical protein